MAGSATGIEKDEEKLVEQFPTWIANVSYWAKHQVMRFVLVLDAIDKPESRTNLRLLPRNVRPHVRIVASSIQGEARDSLANREVVECEDFLKKLDKDRIEKRCEHAILISLLERDSARYDIDIVDVSRRYSQMYVIRPQFHCNHHAPSQLSN